MKIQVQDMERAFQEAIADGIERCRRDMQAITNEVNNMMDQNDADKCSYTIKVEARLKIDKESRKIAVTGCYMAPRANMKEAGSKLDIPITDPNQLEMDLVDGNTGEPIKK